MTDFPVKIKGGNAVRSTRDFEPRGPGFYPREEHSSLGSNPGESGVDQCPALALVRHSNGRIANRHHAILVVGASQIYAAKSRKQFQSASIVIAKTKIEMRKEHFCDLINKKSSNLIDTVTWVPCCNAVIQGSNTGTNIRKSDTQLNLTPLLQRRYSRLYHWFQVHFRCFSM